MRACRQWPGSAHWPHSWREREPQLQPSRRTPRVTSGGKSASEHRHSVCTATGDTGTPEGPGGDLGSSAADASVHGGRLGHAPDPRSYTHRRSATFCRVMPCGGSAVRAGAGCIPRRRRPAPTHQRGAKTLTQASRHIRPPGRAWCTTHIRSHRRCCGRGREAGGNRTLACSPGSPPKVGALHHVGIEAPAFSGVHRGIDTQRCRAFAWHTLTLSTFIDTDWPRPIGGRDSHANSRVLRRVTRGAGRT
jgi:hypothetical protein